MRANHEAPSVAPSWAPPPEPRRERALITCDLCGEDKPADQFSKASRDASGLWACVTCIEQKAEEQVQ